MRILDNILYIEVPELEACDIPRRTILSWDAIKDPSDKRKTLIGYEDLQSKYQDKLIKRFGDPYTYYHRQAIKQYLRNDVKALDYFMTYNKDGITISAEKQKEYLTAANWLNLIIELTSTTSGKKFLKSNDLNGSKFWDFICSDVVYKDERDQDGKKIIKEQKMGFLELEKVCLPYEYQSLLRKVKKYTIEGPVAVVSGKIGNTNSKKVKDELNNALLLEMLASGAQFDDVFIAKKYNNAAKLAGFKPITAPTVGTYRHDNAAILDAYRKGNKSWYNTAGKVIHQDRPSAPLLLINSDDNDLDLYFQDIRTVQRNVKVKGTELTVKKDVKEVNYYDRPVLMVVIDAFNDYILGYAVGSGQTNELVYQAYLNAANHVYELTGSRHLWHQIKTDHWNLKTLQAFYESQATFTPAKAKNARGKVIEQSFGQTWHSKLKEMYPANYKGHNIDAKFKLNADWIDANKKNFPTKDQAPAHIAAFVEEMRQLPSANGKTRQQHWVDAFNAMKPEKKRVITDDQHYMLFGVDHKHPKTGVLLPNTITNNGLLVTFKGTKIFYEVPAHLYLDTLGLTVNVKYDPSNLSSVLAVSQDKKTRFVCSVYQNVPMAIADYAPGTRSEINRRLAEKQSHVDFYVNAKNDRQAILQRAKMQAEGVLQAGVHTKDIMYAAARQLVEDTHYEEIDDEDIDINSLM